MTRSELLNEQRRLEEEAIDGGMSRAIQFREGTQTAEYHDLFRDDSESKRNTTSLLHTIVSQELVVLAKAIEKHRAVAETDTAMVFKILKKCGTNEFVAAVTLKGMFVSLLSSAISIAAYGNWKYGLYFMPFGRTVRPLLRHRQSPHSPYQDHPPSPPFTSGFPR